jgi:NitT/TauT family transport system substrate-binding protein
MQMKKNWFVVIVVIGIVLGCAVVWYLQSLHPPPPASLQEVSICPGPGMSGALLWIAKDQGYFSQHGLNVTMKVREYPLAADAIRDIIAGKLDFVVSPEYSTTQQILNKKPLQIVGVISKADTQSLVARRDKGIEQIPDLEGKKVGRASQSMSEYLLARFFVLNGLSLQNATVVDLKPQQQVDAIMRGEIDAVLIQEPYVYQIRQQLGGNAVVWPANLGQSSYNLVVCNETTVQEHPEIIRALLESSLDAESFVLYHNDDAKKIMQNYLNYDDRYMDNEWQKYHFAVDLSQPLIISMEDETRWMIRNNITAATSVPDFRKYISYTALYGLKPSVVTIIR